MVGHFHRDIVNVVLHGGRTDVIPYDYPIEASKCDEVERILGSSPEEVFHVKDWYKVSDPHYIGAQLWDTFETEYPQPHEEFAMLQERFRDYLPEKLPEGARINPFGVVSYRPKGECGHLRKLINPLVNVKEISELEKYPFPSAKEEWRWKGVEEQVRCWQDEGYVVLGGMNIVLDCVHFLFGMERSFMGLLNGDEVIKAVWDWLEEDRVYVAKRHAAMGVDCLINGDHLASQRGPLLSKETFCKWVLPCYEHIISAAHAIKPDLPWIWHTDGNNDNYIHKELMAIGINVFNPVECEDPHLLKKRYGDKIVLWGTGDWKIMEHGLPRDVRAMVADRMKLARQCGGIILTSNATQFTPLENLVEFCRASEDFGT